MVNVGPLEDIDDESQELFRAAFNSITSAIAEEVTVTGSEGYEGRPTAIVDIIKLHGNPDYTRDGIRPYEGMELVLDFLEETSKKPLITNGDIRDLRDHRDRLSEMKEDKTTGKEAINPQNILFTIPWRFSQSKNKKNLKVLERKEVYGHYKHPRYFKYLDARREQAAALDREYDGPDYSESEQDIVGWASTEPNKSRPPMYVALEKLYEEVLVLHEELDKIDGPPGGGTPAPEPVIINLDKGVNIKPLANVEGIKEGFRELLLLPEIYPGKLKEGSDGEYTSRSRRPVFTRLFAKVSEWTFTITNENDYNIIDETVPFWGAGDKDMRATRYATSFKLKINSERRVRSLIRAALGEELKELTVPGRKPGILLKQHNDILETEPVTWENIIKGKGRNKRLIIDQTFEYLDNKPTTAPELMGVMNSGAIKRQDGLPKKNPFGSTNALAQFLRRHGYKKVDQTVIRDVENRSSYVTTLWGPREK